MSKRNIKKALATLLLSYSKEEVLEVLIEMPDLPQVKGRVLVQTITTIKFKEEPSDGVRES